MTIREGLERLKEPYRSQAIENTEEKVFTFIACDVRDSLENAFFLARV